MGLFFSSFKPGDICILDQTNTSGLTDADPVIVKVIKNLHDGNITIEEIISPQPGRALLNGIQYDVPKTLLKKISDTNIVIRHPLSDPIINDADLDAIERVIRDNENGIIASNDDIDRLSSIYIKANHYRKLFEV